MPRTVNVNYVTKEVKILLHDSETESLAAATAIAAAESAQEAKDVVVDNLQDSLDAIDAKTETEKTELEAYTETKKTEVATLGQGYVGEANTILNAVRDEYGYPFVAATAADMTDTTKIYVYVGSETGYTNGNWYYNDGTAWVSGGVYNAVAFTTDTTLTVSGKAADAKKAGDYALNARTLTTSNRKTISTGSNLNDYTTPGNYKVTTVTIAGSITNIPSALSGMLVVETMSDSTKWMQTYYAQHSSGTKIFVRQKLKTTGAWTSWNEIAYMSNLDFIAEDGDAWEEE